MGTAAARARETAALAFTCALATTACGALHTRTAYEEEFYPNAPSLDADEHGPPLPAPPPQMAPDFELAVSGRPAPLRLQSLRGRVVLVVFFSTWCHDCERLLHDVASIGAGYGDALAIVGVSEDDPPDVPKLPAFAAGAGASFPVGWDRGHAISAEWRVTATPQVYVVDRAGAIRFTHPSWLPEEHRDLEREAAQLLR